MTGLEGIIGLVASVFAILTGLFLAAQYIARRVDRRLDRWIDKVVENTEAMRSLTGRVSALEQTMHGRNVQ